MRRYSLTDVRQRTAEIVNYALANPVRITNYGRTVVHIVSQQWFDKMTAMEERSVRLQAEVDRLGGYVSSEPTREDFRIRD